MNRRQLRVRMEVRSFPALLSTPIPHKKPCAQKFTLDCLLMEVAGANRRWRGPFRYRGSRRESAVALLFSLIWLTIVK